MVALYETDFLLVTICFLEVMHCACVVCEVSCGLCQYQLVNIFGALAMYRLASYFATVTRVSYGRSHSPSPASQKSSGLIVCANSLFLLVFVALNC